jgi:hypothetical protein
LHGEKYPANINTIMLHFINISIKQILFFLIVFTAFSTLQAQYVVDFEGTGETKTAYATGTVTLSGLDWDMTEALIGTLADDWKNGVRSTRIRGYGTSSLTMLEDKSNGAGSISFQYRRYGTDLQVDWKVEYSTDGGTNWTQVGSDFTAPADNNVQTFSETLNITGDIRFRIKRATESGTSNRRLNIDDITITDYIACVTPATQASSIMLQSAGTNQMTVNWTNGNGSSRIVKMNTVNSFTNPVNGTDPVANPVYGGGEQVVYNGSGNSVTVTNLAPSTTYWFRVYEYNCSGTNTFYQTSSASANPSGFSTTAFSTLSVGDYRSKSNGDWTSAATWEVFNGTGWVDASDSPNNADCNVFVRHMVVLNESTRGLKDLIVDSTGHLYRNNALVNNLCYLDVNGDIYCNGWIGNGTTDDAIGFNFKTGNHLIKGTGTFDCYRIRNQALGNNSLVIDMDVRLRWTQSIGGGPSGTNAIYNNYDNSGFHVTVNPGKTLRLVNSTFDASIGISGAGTGGFVTSSSRWGGYTVFGSIIIDGFAWIGSANSVSNPMPYINIKDGGLVNLRYLNLGDNNINSGAAFTIENGGKLEITHAGAASQTWVNSTQGSVDFVMGENATVEYSGNALQNIPGFFTYPNLIFSGTGQKILTEDIVVAADLSITNGSGAVSAGSNSITLAGNWTNYGTAGFAEGTSTVIFNGANIQTLSSPGGENFYRLAINNSENGLTISDNIIVAYQLNLTQGNIHTGGNFTVVSNSASSSVINHSQGSYINGNLRRYVNSTGSYDFPVGTDAQYELANVNLNSATGLAYIDASFTNPHTTAIDITSLGIDVNGTILHELLNYGFWTLTPNAGTYNYDITLTSRGHTNAAAQADAHTIIKRNNASVNWTSQGTHDNADQSMGLGWVTATRRNLNAFSDFAIAKSNDGALPVDLLFFDASLKDGSVVLEWVTASETNNDRFEIERSADNGKIFSVIATIPGMGNTNSETSYTFVDEMVPEGVLYYKLRQFDFDGKWEYVGLKVVSNCP